MPTATPFNNLITFSRGSNATVTGSNGLIQYAPNNLVTFSEQMDSAAWVKINATVTANTAASPEQSVTADTVTASAGAGYHYVAQRPTIVVGLTYTVSMYVRAGTTRYIGFGDAGDTVWHSAYLDTTNGAILNQTNCTASATEVGSGWFRVVSTFTRTSAGYVEAYVGGSNATNNTAPSFTATGTETCIAWGAQLELGSTATTYNPTTVKNLLGFSEAFDNAAWTKSGSSIVTGAQANPVNGLFNAQKLMEDTSTGQHRVFNTTGVTYAASTPVCFSAYVKAAERSFVYFRLNNSGADFVTGFVNLTTGAVTTVTGAGSITATSIGSGWWRIAAIGTSAAATPVSGYIATATSGSVVSYTGDGNSGVYIYGAQLSDSASLDPYVPTPGAAPSSTAFYGPRFDFDPVTLAPRGILIEEQRTNIVTYSDQFNDPTWTKFLITVTANSTVSPDGTTNADTIASTGGGSSALRQIMSTASGTHTATIYAKAGTKSVIQFSANAFSWGIDARANFDLVNGVLGTVDAGLTAVITSAGNGWYRCSVAATKAATAGALLWCIVDSPTSAREATTTAGTLFVWGAQLEAGAFATSYIPTVASTVTRSADVATITGQNFAQWYRQPEGTLVAEFSGPSGGYPLNMTDGTTNNATGIVYVGATTLRGISVVSGAGRFVDMAANAAPAVNKTSYGYRLNDLGGSTNNGAVVANTTAPIPVLDRMFVGTFSNFSFLNGHIRNIRFIPARAADFQLQAL